MTKLEKKSAALRRVALPAAMALLLLITVLPSAGADPASFCNGAFSSSILNAGPGAFNSIISNSLLIMLLMINVAVFSYLIGNAFGFGTLQQFGKAELGEVAITALIVLIFLGTFQAAVFTPVTLGNGGPTVSAINGNFLPLSSVTTSPNLFYNNCIVLAGASETVISDIAPLLVFQQVSNLFSSLTFGFNVNFIGFSVTPLAGLVMISSTIETMTEVVGALILFPLAVAVIMSIIFSLFPFFFYAGIIMRTFPWTRPAGGALLGLFIAFYLVFPMLMAVFLSGVNVLQVVQNNASLYTLFPQSQSIGSAYLPNFYWIGSDFILNFIATVIPQVAYIVFAAVISLIVSFDFMEALGDMLGSPSLSSGQTLRKLL